MELDKNEVLRVLRKKGVDSLYHANTVATTCTFFRAGRLLSRGTVTDRKLPQTIQSTDELDKTFDIWYDIFFDGCDIHEQASKRNFYGPVSLKFDASILADSSITGIWIAKKNPKYWDNIKEEDRWFKSIEELDREYSRTFFDYHIVLRGITNGLPLKPYLQLLILDNPKRSINLSATELPLVAMAMGSILTSYNAMRQTDNHNFLLRVRNCVCRCTDEYKHMTENTAKILFLG